MNCKRCGCLLPTNIEEERGLCCTCGKWLQKVPPLWGHEWFDAHKDDVLPEQSIQVYCDGKPVAYMYSSVKPGTLKKVLRAFNHPYKLKGRLGKELTQILTEGDKGQGKEIADIQQT